MTRAHSQDVRLPCGYDSSLGVVEYGNPNRDHQWSAGRSEAPVQRPTLTTYLVLLSAGLVGFQAIGELTIVPARLRAMAPSAAIVVVAVAVGVLGNRVEGVRRSGRRSDGLTVHSRQCACELCGGPAAGSRGVRDAC